MKLVNIFIGLGLLVSVTACDDFLDVRPKSQILEKEMFEKASGFEDAIYGVYGSLQSQKLYGQNMIWGTTEVLASNLGSSYHNLLEPLSLYDYTENKYVRPLFLDIWTSMYETVGYANNVLKQLEDESTSSLPLYNYYKGEMLGMRAFLHFDLLRMFASTNETAKAIPYVKDFSYKVNPILTVKEVYEYIIADLEEAEELLKGDEDLIQYPHQNTNYSKFLNYRETHFNLYAVKALLARVYWMKGNMTEAAKYARMVIDSKKYPLVDCTEIEEYMAGRLSPKEAIFGVYSNVYNENSRDLLYTYTSYKSYNPYSSATEGDYIRPYESIYAMDNDNSSADFRLTHFHTTSVCLWYKMIDFNTLGDKATADWTSRIEGITLMHTSELYLIAAEALLSTDYDSAIGYFDEELQSRGLTGFKESGKTLTLDNIYNEYCKEMFGEGQVWYNMKRLKKDIISNRQKKAIPASDMYYVIPIPDEEYEYRQ